MEGLIRILYEQDTPFMGTDECCDTVTSQFISNNEKEPYEWLHLRIYKKPAERTTDYLNLTSTTRPWDFWNLKGKTVQEMYDEVKNDDTNLCRLYNLLLQIDEDNRLSESGKSTLQKIIKEICPDAVVVEPPSNELCTEPDSEEKMWYKFEYPEGYFVGARDEFRYEILNKVRGTSLFGPGAEAKCIENLKVWYEGADTHVTSKAYTNYQAPKLEWWNGFKIRCECVTQEPYKSKNLKITELKHRLANPDKVITPTEKSSTTQNIIKSKPKDDDKGLETIIKKDPVDIETSYDVDFL
tara:strand:- start:36 stop:926 length:891 start_codon:yes stop_codon:yes gene_type:complete